ncbi:MAG: NUDIX domain-containing protein [Oscillospiraceae bacterium]|jgi:8-oxo-dGTP diphosphatase
MTQDSHNWALSAAGVVLHDGKVLLARHTYSYGKGKLIIPGGYLQEGELPEEAVQREVLEETGITVAVREFVGIRFNQDSWYAIFVADYISGEAQSDGHENNEVLWLDPLEATTREDVPDLTREAIKAAVFRSDRAFVETPYRGTTRHGAYRFYTSPQKPQTASPRRINHEN